MVRDKIISLHGFTKKLNNNTSKNMIAKIEQLLKEVEALHASNAEELEALRIKCTSKKGSH